MKRVSFGENTVIIIEDISKYLLWPSSFIQNVEVSSRILSEIREIHNEKPNLNLIYRICEIIVDHDDVYHVDIHLRNNTTEKFIVTLSNCMECIFSHSKSCNLLIGSSNKMYFKDGYSNPSLSLDENFRIEEHWETN